MKVCRGNSRHIYGDWHDCKRQRVYRVDCKGDGSGSSKRIQVNVELCANVERIGELEQTVNNGIKDKTEENTRSIRGLRKFLFWALMSLILIGTSGIITIIFT